MKKMYEGIAVIENQNTRTAIQNTYLNLRDFAKLLNRLVEDLTNDDIIRFLRSYYSNKSKTTIANTISHLKYLFGYIDKINVMDNINLYKAYEELSIKKQSYFTPNEIYTIIEELKNYQDKALILLCYIGLYDTMYNTIQNLKDSDIHENYIEAKGKKIRISAYASEIFRRAKEETENISYTTGRVYPLKEKNGYFLRNKKSNKIEQDYMSVTCLKRKLQQIAEYLGLTDFTAINIKNSRTIYNLVKMEYKYNDGFDINAVELKNYLKDTKTKGCLELLNVDKKNIKDAILMDIIQKKDFYV